ncbi:MAG: hypothetical protein BWY66_01345 [bacterium ADurb.Bin374]|nr:MAG: hypothetical protein BWY66_01345 [bacterium ADurb.Bin374]
MTGIRRFRGFTFIELLIAAVITGLLIFGVFKVLLGARHAAGLAAAKGAAKDMTEVILKALERDISNSRATAVMAGSGGSQKPVVVRSFKQAGSDWTMLVPEGNSSKRITYRMDGKKLSRVDASGTTRLLCESVEDLRIADLSEGQIAAEVKIGLIPDGMKDPVIHHQRLLITIREAVEAALDPRWRNTNDVLTHY